MYHNYIVPGKLVGPRNLKINEIFFPPLKNSTSREEDRTEKSSNSVITKVFMKCDVIIKERINYVQEGLEGWWVGVRAGG